MSGGIDFDPPEDDMEILAAELVLGLLTVAQLPHVVALRQGSTRFDNAVNQWELRLLPLAEAIEPVQPPAHIWRAIAAAIAPASEPAGIWDNIRFWRNFGFGTALLGAALAVALIAVLSRRRRRWRRRHWSPSMKAFLLRPRSEIVPAFSCWSAPPGL